MNKKNILIIILIIAVVVLVAIFGPNLYERYQQYRIRQVQESLIQPVLITEQVSGTIISMEDNKITVAVGPEQEREFVLNEQTYLKKTPPGGGAWQLASQEDLNPGNLVNVYLNTLNEETSIDKIEILPPL